MGVRPRPKQLVAVKLENNKGFKVALLSIVSCLFRVDPVFAGLVVGAD
jgi:hypothetical protein